MKTTVDYFAEWYSSIEPTITKEIKDNRIESLRTLLKDHNIEFWLDVVRLYLNDFNGNNSLEAFVKSFTEVDVNFPVSNNQNLIRVLAAIAICLMIDEDPNERKKSVVAYAVICANFYNNLSVSDRIPVKAKCLKYINDNEISSKKQIEIAFEETEEHEEGDAIAPYIDELKRKILEAAKNQKKTAEESNILWYLIGEYSPTLKQFFIDAYPSIIIVSAYELFNIIQFDYAPISQNQIFKRLLSKANNKAPLNNISVDKIIDSLDVNQIDEVKMIDNLSIFTPINSALYYSNIIGKSGDWQTSFKLKYFNADVKLEMSPSDISSQLLYEYLFLKTRSLYEQ